MLKKCTVSFLLVVAVCLASAQSGVDQTRNDIENYQNYQEVIETTVEMIEKSRTFGTTRGFLRLLAFVETRDGEFQTKGKGGLWGISMNQFNQVKRSSSLIKPYVQDVRRQFNVLFQDRSFAYSNLDKPLISALFSILYLIDQLRKYSLDLRDIPMDRADQDEFYAMYYCEQEDNNCKMKFTDGYERFLRQTRQQPCDPQADIIFLLDGSGSIGLGHFQVALSFIANLTNLYDISSDDVRVGLIVYESDVTPQFPLDRYFHKSDLLDAIKNISYPSGGTRTGAAIEYAIDFGFNTSFGVRPLSKAVPRILIVLTDGQSGDDVSMPAMRAKMSGLNLFSIGIANANDKELHEIASSTNQVYFVRTFSRLSQVTLLIRTASCKSSALVDKNEPVARMVTKGQLEKLQVILEDNEQLSITFSTEPGNELIIYASFRFRNPGPNQYDFIWHVSDGEYTVSTTSADGNRKRRQVPGDVASDAQTLFMAIEAVNETVSLTVEVNASDVTVEPYGDLCPLVIALGNATYECKANCTGTDARVTWEKESFDGSLPDSATVTTSIDGRCSVLVLDPSSPDYYGRYYCVLRSPRVIGSKRASIEFPVECLNNGTNIDPDLCDCPEGWGGPICDQRESCIYVDI